MPVLRILMSMLLSLALIGCVSPDGAAQKGAPGPVEVAVVTIQPTSVTLTRELPGRVAARRVADVRARVDGIVEERLFTEGTDVVAGQELYRIEAAPYRAELAAAKANLARAEATQANSKVVAERDKSLVKSNAVSSETQQSSEAALEAATAEVAATRAALRSAEIDLQYTTVTAPIAGRIGQSDVTEGAYVQRSAATLMTTIQQLDTVYVYITQSSVELLRLRRALEAESSDRGGQSPKLTLLLEDGTQYSETGELDFTGATVDESTGSVSLRAVFSNPRRELLPGMFVRARVEQATYPNALLVPQRGVTRDARGRAVAMVVNPEGVVERREIVADQAFGNAWLVSEGLSAGDRVIVDGLQKVRPGAEVTVVEAAKP